MLINPAIAPRPREIDGSQNVVPTVPRRPRLAVPILAGVSIIALFFGGFGAWAALAHLDSAAIAPGVVVVEGHRKTIQHLEGGIIAEIAVAEGERVEAGQRLIRLDQTIAASRLELLKGRHLETAALIARLTAERNGDSQIAFPNVLTDESDDARITDIRRGQVRIFALRQETLQGQTAILGQQVAQLHEEIKGLGGKIEAEDRQLALLADETSGIRSLVDKGLARRPQLLELQRRAADIEGGRRQNQALIARAEQSIAEAELRTVELAKNRLAEVVELDRQAQSDLFDLAEQIRAAEDVLRRTEIQAPLSGTIVDLRVHTPGGVIAPGQPLLDIVPSDQKLVILAKVDPRDIDVVRPGLISRVQLTAFNQRDVDPIEGVVTSISADRLTDPQSGYDHYLVKIENPDSWQAELQGQALLPGMQAEVIIVTGERTPLQYLLNPITRSINRAFRDS